MLEQIEEREALARKLGSIDEVRKFDSSDHDEANALAYSLGDIEESMSRIQNVELPKLLQTDNAEEIRDGLLDIGEELRHILYHVRDSRFFGYLAD